MTRFFNTFVARQGEHATLAIIENWERHASVKAEVTAPLEQRWERMMHGPTDAPRCVA
jgi:hypothetical protein